MDAWERRERFSNAVARGNRTLAKKCLREGGVPASVLADEIRYAVQGKREKAVALLLELGANPNSREQYAGPLLHMAGASPKIVKRLLDAGANPKAFSSRRTALHELAMPFSISEVGARNFDARDRIATMKLLVNAGCPIDALDDGKRTALYYAASSGRSKPPPAVRKGSLQFLEALLKAGADPCATRELGAPWRPIRDRKKAFLLLIEAARGQHEDARDRHVWPEAVKLLCKHGNIAESELPSLESRAELKKKQRAERAEEERERRALSQFLKATVKALREARGNTTKLTAAIDQYLEQGTLLECSPLELWDHFAISSPGLPEKAGYKRAEVEAAEKLFEKRSKKRFR